MDELIFGYSWEDIQKMQQGTYVRPIIDINKKDKVKKDHLPEITSLVKIGDHIHATRKVKSKIYNNMVLGPVVDVWSNACRVVTNQGTEIEGDFKLYYSDWLIETLDI